jgi:hypothetical protein
MIYKDVLWFHIETIQRIKQRRRYMEISKGYIRFIGLTEVRVEAALWSFLDRLPG